jgi:hypothetical protein
MVRQREFIRVLDRVLCTPHPRLSPVVQLRGYDSPLLPPSGTSDPQEQADLISLLRSKEKNLSQEVLFLRCVRV